MTDAVARVGLLPRTKSWAEVRRAVLTCRREMGGSGGQRQAIRDSRAERRRRAARTGTRVRRLRFSWRHGAVWVALVVLTAMGTFSAAVALAYVFGYAVALCAWLVWPCRVLTLSDASGARICLAPAAWGFSRGRRVVELTNWAYSKDGDPGQVACGSCGRGSWVRWCCGGPMRTRSSCWRRVPAPG